MLMTKLAQSATLVVMLVIASQIEAQSKESKPPAESTPKPETTHVYRLERSDVHRIDAAYLCWIVLPAMEVQHWELIAAYPPQLPWQRIERVVMTPDGESAKERSPMEQPILRARLTTDPKGERRRLAARIDYRAILTGRKLVQVPPHEVAGAKPGATLPKENEVAERFFAVEPLSENDHQRWTAATSTYNYTDEEFTAWIEAENLKRRPDEVDLEYARRVFQFMRKRFSFTPQPLSERTAAQVCALGSSDTAGLAIGYVGTLRSQGVPARVAVGRWVRRLAQVSREGTAGQSGIHLRPEFYAARIGWIPADLSRALLFDRTTEGEWYFGADAGDFLTFHFDDPIEYDTQHYGEQKVSWLTGIVYWPHGKGHTAGAQFFERWQFESTAR